MEKLTIMQGVLVKLFELQASTSPIELSIGHTAESGQVKHGDIIIKNAAPKVVAWLAEQDNLMVSVNYRGLHVTTLK